MPFEDYAVNDISLKLSLFLIIEKLHIKLEPASLIAKEVKNYFNQWKMSVFIIINYCMIIAHINPHLSYYFVSNQTLCNVQSSCKYLIKLIM